jgi:molybdenum-dependent DNA-binding transcriptional regulator ModE
MFLGSKKCALLKNIAQQGSGRAAQSAKSSSACFADSQKH